MVDEPSCIFVSEIPSPETEENEFANTAGLRPSEIICWAKTEAVGARRVLIWIAEVGKSVNASPPKDRAVLAVAAVIIQEPSVEP